MALAAASSLSIALAGCAPPPPAADQAELDEWQMSWSEDLAARTDVVSGTSGVVPEDPAESRMELGYTEPVRIDGFDVACFAEGTIEVSWEIRAVGSGVSGSAPVECTGAAVLVPLGAPVPDVEELVWSVAKRDGSPQAFQAAVIGAAG